MSRNKVEVEECRILDINVLKDVCKRGGDCDNRPITREDLEEQILENIRRIKLDENILERLKTRAKTRIDEELQYEFSKRDNLEGEYKEISEKISTLIQLRINNEISADELQVMKAPLIVRKDELEGLREAVKFDREEILKQLELFFENCFNMEELFINGTFEEKSQLVHAISENLTLDDKKLGWNFKEPWSNMVLVDFDDENFNWGG